MIVEKKIIKIINGNRYYKQVSQCDYEDVNNNN